MQAHLVESDGLTSLHAVLMAVSASGIAEHFPGLVVDVQPMLPRVVPVYANWMAVSAYSSTELDVLLKLHYQSRVVAKLVDPGLLSPSAQGWGRALGATSDAAVITRDRMSDLVATVAELFAAECALRGILGSVGSSMIMAGFDNIFLESAPGRSPQNETVAPGTGRENKTMAQVTLGWRVAFAEKDAEICASADVSWKLPTAVDAFLEADMPTALQALKRLAGGG